MAKCPKCGAEIDCLTNLQTGTQEYDMSIKDGEVEYEAGDFEPGEGGGNVWICPECFGELFTDEESSANFLMQVSEDFAREVLSEGEKVTFWACDVNLEGEEEGNAGTENLIKYGKDWYLIITDVAGEQISKGGFSKVDIAEEKEEGSAVAEAIEDYRP